MCQQTCKKKKKKLNHLNKMTFEPRVTESFCDGCHKYLFYHPVEEFGLFCQCRRRNIIVPIDKIPEYLNKTAILKDKRYNYNICLPGDTYFKFFQKNNRDLLYFLKIVRMCPKNKRSEVYSEYLMYKYNYGAEKAQHNAKNELKKYNKKRTNNKYKKICRDAKIGQAVLITQVYLRNTKTRQPQAIYKMKTNRVYKTLSKIKASNRNLETMIGAFRYFNMGS